MNPTGILVVVAGVLVVVQVTSGKALERLGVVGGSTSPSTQTDTSYTPAADPGLTSTKPSKPKAAAPAGWTFGAQAATA